MRGGTMRLPFKRKGPLSGGITAEKPAFGTTARFLFLLTKRMSDRQIPGKVKIASLVHAWLNL